MTLLVCNWGADDVHIAKGGLLAQAFAVSEIKVVEQETGTGGESFEKFEVAMALYQKLLHCDAKTIYSSVESYEEFFNDAKINKEDVSFARIGPEWPKVVEQQLREIPSKLGECVCYKPCFA